MLPIARAGADSADLTTALFTATSAVALTGLVVVDTATYWSHFGQLVILALIQLGGLGIMTLATLASLAIVGRMGVRGRLNAAAEGRGRAISEVKPLLLGVLGFTVAIEALVAALLTLRFRADMDWPAAVWEGVFHSISAFNNAGFGLKPDNLVAYVGDPAVIFPIAAAIILGGLGFPVLTELFLRLRVRRKSSLTLVFTLWGTVVLLVVGTVVTAALEWNGVLQGFSTPEKLLAAWFHSVSSRTAGFNSVDVGHMHPSTLAVTNVLMFIGGGSGGTAGGVKITTLAVLVSVLVSEVCAQDQVLVRGRRIPDRTVRQALAVLVISLMLIGFGVTTIQILAPQCTSAQVTFEVFSAFATVGLSTGITAALPTAAKYVLIVLMYAGRIGPITVVAALAARQNRKLYSFPEERPFIG